MQYKISRVEESVILIPQSSKMIFFENEALREKRSIFLLFFIYNHYPSD